MGDGPSEVLRLWNESAPYWEKHSRAIQAMFKPISKAMIADARISTRDVVLDVAAGTGDPTLDIARVCGPGGWVVGTDAVWGASEFNPFFSILPPILQRYVPIPPTAPDAPGAFRFAEPGKLAGLLEAAGASQVHERAIDFAIEADVSLEDFWTLRSEMSDTLRERAKQLSPAQLASVKRDVQVECKPYFAADRMSFPARCLIVGAVKPPNAATP